MITKWNDGRLTSDALVEGRLRVRHLSLLVALGEFGNMRKTAVRLNLTQSAISKLVRETEEILGVTLFERGKRGIAPTPSGQVMIRRAQLLLTDLAGAREELVALQGGASGLVRVGVLLVAEPILLPRALLRLKTESPAISVIVREGDREVLLAALRNGQLDCVIGRLGFDGADANLRSEVLYEEPVSIVARAGHPLAKLRSVTWAMLSEEEWILPPHGAPLRQILDARFISLGFTPPRSRIQSTSFLTNKTLVVSTSMICAMTFELARHYAEIGELEILDVSSPELTLPPVGFLMRDTPPAPALETFLKALRSEAQLLAGG